MKLEIWHQGRSLSVYKVKKSETTNYQCFYTVYVPPVDGPCI